MLTRFGFLPTRNTLIMALNKYIIDIAVLFLFLNVHLNSKINIQRVLTWIQSFVGFLNLDHI